MTAAARLRSAACPNSIFSALLTGFYIIEEVIIGKWHGKTFSDSIPVIDGGSLEGILVVGIIMFVCLMPFFALREVGRVIGDDKLYELYFSCNGPSMLAALG